MHAEPSPVHVDSLGSEGFDNPNAESNESMPYIPQITPLSENNTIALSKLPNGVYGLELFIAADGHLVEEGLSEDIIMDELRWTQENIGVSKLSTDVATVLYCETDQSPHKIYTAPDPTTDTSDPYDPNHPDDPNNPDDSDDIGMGPDENGDGEREMVTKEWVDENQYNIAYRIIDSNNITINGSENEYDVSDTLPTTFAFYLHKTMMPDNIYNYKYYTSYYYEISKAEYDSASQEAKDNNEYVKVGNAYARRFATDSLSGGKWLRDVIVLNQKSPGFVNYSEINDEEVIVGAIYNTEWLNEQLAKQSDGQYRIFVFVDIVMTYETKYSGQQIEIQMESRPCGIITIKNRQLVDLD